MIRKLLRRYFSPEPLTPEEEDRNVREVMFAIYAIFVVAVGLWALWRAGARLVPRLPELLQPWWTRLIGVPVVLVLALLLYELRVRRLRTYAAVEIGFAMTMSFIALGQVSQHGIGAWTAVVSAVYIAVRGLDNMTRRPERARAKPG